MVSPVLAPDSRSIVAPERAAHISPYWVPIAAWAAILVASDLDSIVAKVAGLGLPEWATLPRVAALLILAFVIPRTGRLLELRGYILALAAMVSGDWLMFAIENHIPWFTVATRSDRMLAGVFISLIPAAFMGLTLIRSGISRREMFLTSGDMRARTALPLIRGARWNVVAPVLLLFISGGLIAQLWIVSNASHHFHPAMLLSGLPLAALFAVVNASSEEFRFRCVLLSRGIRALGVMQAIATSSVLFGLAHYGGHPSGISGMAMAGFFAWIMARSMVDTGGWGWAWLLHVIQDVIIFLMVFMTGV